MSQFSWIILLFCWNTEFDYLVYIFQLRSILECEFSILLRVKWSDCSIGFNYFSSSSGSSWVPLQAWRSTAQT